MAEPSQSDISDILKTAKTVAVVGASLDEDKPSNEVTRYLARAGYTVFPVNPGHAGKEIAGLTIYRSLADVPAPIDIVDVFRAADAMPGIVAEALLLDPLPKVFWMQLGLRNDVAAAQAEAAGITVVQNHCTKIEHARRVPR